VDEALSLLGELHFDVAVLDVKLDGGDSFPVADALVACGTPFLFATGYGGGGIAECYRDRPFSASRSDRSVWWKLSRSCSQIRR
jgi:CheY-like chemotaxis protein